MKTTAAGYTRYTIQDIKAANTAAGHFFFTRDTMRFFGNTMRDFKVVHVDLTDGTQEVYVTANNHRAPAGVDPVSVYRFNPDTADISRVDLTSVQVNFMRRWGIGIEQWKATEQTTADKSS